MRRLLLAAACAACAAQTPLRLPNGLRATLMEQHDSPLVRVLVRLPVAEEDLPPGRPGLPGLFLRVWRSGTIGLRSADTFNAALEQSGIRLEAKVDHQGLRLAMLARSSDQELALGLLADLLLRASLEHGPLELQRQRLFQDTIQLGAEPLAWARLRAQNGPEAPPTEQSLASFSLADLVAFRDRVLRPERATVVLAGDLTPAQARQVLLLSLGTWAPAPMPGRLGGTAAAPPPVPPGFRLLSLPALRLRPLLEELLRPNLPNLHGTGLPGDPWIATESEATAAQARPPQAADLVRAQRAWRAALLLRGLDPEARLAEALDPGPQPAEVEAVTLAEAQAAWRDLFRN